MLRLAGAIALMRMATGRLFDFTGRYSFADREIWTHIDGTLKVLRTPAANRSAFLMPDVVRAPGCSARWRGP